MSHFAVAVILPLDTTDVDAATARLLGRFAEPADGAHVGWWRIGGRFTGTLDGHAPEPGRENAAICSLCSGTGVRREAGRLEAEYPGWIERTGGCNGCQGRGRRAAAAAWSLHAGSVAVVGNALFERLRADVTVAAVVSDGTSCAVRAPLESHFEAVVTPAGEWIARDASGIAELLRAYDGHGVVVVDCHRPLDLPIEGAAIT